MSTIFEKLGVTYTEGENGILYPDIVLNEEEPHYSKYGYLRKRYLQEQRPALFSSLSLKGQLVKHLNEVDDECWEQAERLEREFAKAEGVTERLKAENQMEWVRRMNSIQNRVDELICQEYIYI